MPLIYPVIHYLNDQNTIEQVALAKQCGADGVFLISHSGGDRHIIEMARLLQLVHGEFFIGVNLLNSGPIDAYERSYNAEVDGVWMDVAGVTSAGLDETGQALKKLNYANDRCIPVFASVAFKYQPVDKDPAKAAYNAYAAGFIPTTSGAGTGQAPDVEKIRLMSEASYGVLAIASGMTPENVSMYAPYLSHILVSTGVSSDFHHLDPDKLKALIANSRVSQIDSAP